MWKSDDDEDFTLGFNLSKSPLNLSKYINDTMVTNEPCEKKFYLNYSVRTVSGNIRLVVFNQFCASI